MSQEIRLTITATLPAAVTSYALAATASEIMQKTEQDLRKAGLKNATFTNAVVNPRTKTADQADVEDVTKGAGHPVQRNKRKPATQTTPETPATEPPATAEKTYTVVDPMIPASVVLPADKAVAKLIELLSTATTREQVDTLVRDNMRLGEQLAADGRDLSGLSDAVSKAHARLAA